MNRPLAAWSVLVLLSLVVWLTWTTAATGQVPPKTTGPAKKGGKQPDTADTAGGKGEGKKRREDEKPKLRPAPPLNYAYARIDELEQAIADRLAALRTADPVGAMPISADLSYRLAARALLKAGVDLGGARGAVHLLYGHTLADYADSAQQMFDKAATAMKAPAAPAAPRYGDLFNTFNSAAERAVLAPGDAPEAVDQYLRAIIGPMISILQALQKGDPITTWIVLPAGGEARQVVPVKAATPQSVEALVKRIQAAPMSSATRADLVLLMDGLRKDVTLPEKLGDVTVISDGLNAALDIADTLTAATWLGEGTVADLKKKMEIGMMLLRDRRVRQAGIDRFNAMKRSLQLVRQVNDLDKQSVNVAPMRDIFLKIHEMQSIKQDLNAADLLTTYLESLTRQMAESRALKVDALPADLKRIAQALQKEYSTLETSLLAKLPDLAKDPALILGPRPPKPKAPTPTAQIVKKAAGVVETPPINWGATLEQMSEKLDQVRRVCLLTEWGDRMNKYKPRVAGAPGRALRTIANNLLLPAPKGAQADQALRAVQAQLSRFDPIPGEESLRKPDEAAKAMLGDTAASLADQLDKQRGEWATGWGNGSDPVETTAKLDKLARLIGMIHDAAALSEMETVIDRLNRWAGWQSRTEAVKPLVSRMQENLTGAAKAAAIGNWPEFDLVIADVELQSPLPNLLALLNSRIGVQLGKAPGDLAGLGNQCLFPPQTGAFGIDHRNNLAQISIYLMEAAHSLNGKNEEAADAVLQYCGERSQMILNGLAPAPPPAPEAAPAPAPAPPAK